MTNTKTGYAAFLGGPLVLMLAFAGCCKDTIYSNEDDFRGLGVTRGNLVITSVNDPQADERTTSLVLSSAPAEGTKRQITLEAICHPEGGNALRLQVRRDFWLVSDVWFTNDPHNLRRSKPDDPANESRPEPVIGLSGTESFRVSITPPTNRFGIRYIDPRKSNRNQPQGDGDHEAVFEVVAIDENNYHIGIWIMHAEQDTEAFWGIDSCKKISRIEFTEIGHLVDGRIVRSTADKRAVFEEDEYFGEMFVDE